MTLISAGLAIGSSLLAPKPKAPTSSQAASDRLFASINLRAARHLVFGHTAMATEVRDQEYTENQTVLHRFLVIASHKVQAVEQIWFDDKLAWAASGGAQGEFSGYLTVTPVLEGSAANAINISSRMGSSRRFTGLAYLHLRYKLTGNGKNSDSPFAQSIPTRVTVIGKAALVYDPRLDSTAGGVGPQRAGDQSTWVWSDDAARNPALQLLWYLLGWRIQNPVTGQWKLAVGKGIPPERIDLDSFITAANLCDEQVARAAGGTEPRYRSDGIFSEADDPSLVLDNLKAAMNADLDDVDGKLRITVLHNDLGSPQIGLTAADVLDSFKWTQTPPLTDSFNIIRGSYTDPSTTSLYQQVDYPEVRIDSPDGIDRVETVNLTMVQSPSQAQRLVKQRLQRALYGGMFEAVFQATAWRYRKGDVVPFTFPALGWVNKLFRVVSMTIQVDGTVPMTLREEHPDIYLWDASDAPAVQGADPTTYSNALLPIVRDINDLGELIVSASAVADQALSQIAALSDDGVLTPNEKITKLVPLQGELANAFGLLDTQAAQLSGVPAVAEARSVADDAYNAWADYLATLSPAWNDTGNTTFVNREVFDGKINDLRYALAMLQVALQRAASITGYLTSESVVLAADSAGEVSSFTDAGGAFKVFVGLSDVSTGAGTAYSVLSTNGVAIAIDAASGVYTVSGMSADTGSATLRASYGGVMIDRVYRIAKARAGAGSDGAPANVLVLTKHSIQLRAYADGAVRGYDSANGQATVRSGNTDITSGVVLSLSAVGCTATINTGFGNPVAGKPKGWYQVTDMASDDASLTISATVGGQTLSDVVSVAKLIGGYEILDTVPSDDDPYNFEGRQVQSRADGKLWRFHNGHWSSSVPAADLVGTVASSQLGIGVGGNQLIGAVPGTNPRNYMRFAYNPDGVQYYDVTTGNVTTGGQGVLQSLNFGYDPGPFYSLPDGSTFMIYQPNTQTGGAGFSDIRMARMKNQNGDLDEMWPIEEGKTYEFSLWACTYGCRAAVLIVWFDGDGNALSETPTGDPVANSYALLEPDEVSGHTTLDGYKRIYNRGKSPPGGRQAMLVFRKAHTAPNPANSSRLFGMRPMFAETTENATEMLPYSVPPYGFFMAENVVARSIVGDKVAFNTLVGNHMQIGSIDAARLAVTELSAITARIGVLRTAGSGARVEVRDNAILLYGSNNVLRGRWAVV
ncbi:phage tail protein [Sphingomonas sp. ABOLE]|uniref:phage tail protein n=1 Tax=Sphingomonas sp. ABOLE TaxID=1985878 RepID=UPI0013DF03FD|nr:phage tail protein [Sphingomonas sp. ABOLE]